VRCGWSEVIIGVWLVAGMIGRHLDAAQRMRYSSRMNCIYLKCSAGGLSGRKMKSAGDVLPQAKTRPAHKDRPEICRTSDDLCLSSC